MEGNRQEKEATEVASDVSLQEEETPPVDDKRSKTLPCQIPSPGEVEVGWEPKGSQYEWDEEVNEEGTPSFWAYEVGTP